MELTQDFNVFAFALSGAWGFGGRTHIQPLIQRKILSEGVTCTLTLLWGG